MKKILLVSFVLIFSILFCFETIIASPQNENNDVCEPHDIIFIMGSPMESVSWVLDALVMQQLTKCQDSGEFNQVGIISILNEGESSIQDRWFEEENENDFDYLNMQLTPIDYSSLDEWNSIREEKIKLINENQILPNFYLGEGGRLKGSFVAAIDQMAKAKSGRKQLIIYVGYPVAHPSASDEYYSQIFDQLNTLIEDAKKKNSNIEFHSVLVNSDSLNQAETILNSYYRDWDNMMDSVYPKINEDRQYSPVNYFTNEWENSNAVLEILKNSGVIDSEIVSFGCQKEFISPYQATMEMYIFADSSDLELALEYEGDLKNYDFRLGDDLDNHFGLVFNGKNISENDLNKNYLMLISDPPPGYYKITEANDRCSEFIGYRIMGRPKYEWNYSDEDFYQYQLGNKFDIDHPNQIEIKFINPYTKEPLLIYDNYLPEFISKTGAQTIDFSINSNSKALLSEPLNVENSGENSWVFDIQFPINENKKYETVFSDISGSYFVNEVIDIKPYILSPSLEDYEEDEIQLHGYVIPEFLKTRSVYIEVAFIDYQTNEYVKNLGSIFKDPNEILSVYLEHAQTGEKSDVIQLKQSIDDKNLLVGFIGDDISLSGKYYLHFEKNGDLKSEASNYRLIFDETREYNFIRDDGFFSKPIIWYVILGILGVILGVILFYQASLFISPLNGELIFTRPDSEQAFAKIKLKSKRRLNYSNSKLDKTSPILRQIISLNIDKVGDAINMEVLTNDEQRKVKRLKDGDSFEVSKMINVKFKNLNK